MEMDLKQTLRCPCELRKAIKLIQQDQIKKISDSLFIVRGTHHNPLGYYVVEKLKSGVWICNCDGFKKRKATICSHVVAVMVLQSCENSENKRTCLEKAAKEVVGHG